MKFTLIDVLEKIVADNNIIILDYIVCNRDAPNDARSFTLLQTVVQIFQMSQSQQLITLQVVIVLKQWNQLNTMHQEIIQHKIEFSGLTDDYKVLVKSLYANAQSVQVYNNGRRCNSWL